MNEGDNGTMTITEFLLARITEDEAAARAASSGPWTFSDIDSIGGGTIYDPTVAIANVEWDNEGVDPRIRRTRPDHEADANGYHIARHNPARVLAECVVKRAIVELAMYWDDYRDGSVTSGVSRERLGEVLRLLAAGYVAHPDYQQEWKLDTLNGSRP